MPGTKKLLPASHCVPCFTHSAHELGRVAEPSRLREKPSTSSGSQIAPLARARCSGRLRVTPACSSLLSCWRGSLRSTSHSTSPLPVPASTRISSVSSTHAARQQKIQELLIPRKPVIICSITAADGFPPGDVHGVSDRLPRSLLPPEAWHVSCFRPPNPNATPRSCPLMFSAHLLQKIKSAFPKKVAACPAQEPQHLPETPLLEEGTAPLRSA